MSSPRWFFVPLVSFYVLFWRAENICITSFQAYSELYTGVVCVTYFFPAVHLISVSNTFKHVTYGTSVLTCV